MKTLASGEGRTSGSRCQPATRVSPLTFQRGAERRRWSCRPLRPWRAAAQRRQASARPVAPHAERAPEAAPAFQAGLRPAFRSVAQLLLRLASRWLPPQQLSASSRSAAEGVFGDRHLGPLGVAPVGDHAVTQFGSSCLVARWPASLTRQEGSGRPGLEVNVLPGPLQAVFLTGTGADGLTYVNPKTLSAAVRGAFAPTPVHFN